MQSELFSTPSTEAALSLMDQFWQWLATSGVRILVILVVGALARLIGGWLIRRFFRTMVESGTALTSMTSSVVRRDRKTAKRAQERRRQRSETLSTVAVNVLGMIIAVISLVMILSEIGMDVAPIIASLGVVGLAAGIGAQTFIKDAVAGVVMLFEDIVAVGDIVDLEYATGTVVNINLRVTQLRSLDGVLWTVRNGEIIRVGNMSRGFARALVLVDIDAEADNARVSAALDSVSEGIWEDEAWRPMLLERPAVSGILSVDGARFQRRVLGMVEPGQQWDVEQELRRRIRLAFQDEGIEFALPRIGEQTA